MTITQLAAIIGGIVTILGPTIAAVWWLSRIVNKLEAALERVTRLENSHARIAMIEQSNALLAQKLEWQQGTLVDNIRKIEELEEHLVEARRG